jgi:hypothetical protein
MVSSCGAYRRTRDVPEYPIGSVLADDFSRFHAVDGLFEILSLDIW